MTQRPVAPVRAVQLDNARSPASQGRRVLLTGITGNLGAMMAWRLLQEGCQVFAIARQRGLSARERALQTLHMVSGQPVHGEGTLSSRLTVLDMSITDADAMQRLCLPDAIDETWHFASTVKFMPKDRVEIYQVNLRGLEATLELHCRHAAPAAPICYVSTAYIAGKATTWLPESRLPFQQVTSFHNDYERSKYQAEALFLDAVETGRVSGYVARPSIVVDAAAPCSLKSFHGYYVLVQSLANFNRYLVNRDEPCRLRLNVAPDNLVNFIPLDDAISRLWALRAARPPNGSVFNVCNSMPLTVAGVVDALNPQFSHLDLELVAQDAFARQPKTPYESLLAYNTVYTAPYCHEKLRFAQDATQALLGSSFCLDYTPQRLARLNKRYLETKDFTLLPREPKLADLQDHHTR